MGDRMTVADRWLLPDGVEEILPAQAHQIEAMRRRLLDLYDSWGYELVMPPLIEFSESLLIGLGSDMDLQTFKVTDQISGRTLAIRPDITPQAARIDAHSFAREGATRLCYAGTVLHTRPKSPLASRTPLEVGAELYGDSSCDSDIEIICLMLETLQLAGVSKLHLDLGHVGIFKGIVAAAGLDDVQQQELFELYRRKAMADLGLFVQQNVKQEPWRTQLRELAALNGDISVLENARSLFRDAPEAVSAALAQLSAVAGEIQQRVPDVTLFFDLSELRGYQYHTGLVFAAYAIGYGEALANGGRYDNVGAVFGRARPATGFSADLKAITSLLATQGESEQQRCDGIFAPSDRDPDLWVMIKSLRSQGERVVAALGNQSYDPDMRCNRKLCQRDGVWQVTDINNKQQ